ncbi:hypothetical protein [Rufibacter ruber]|uniref:hypothetical protein n=1 Tax=Rufibacter ruber TaxID=1783499 RepID=UPI000830D698|nr:hypothetical protein [Rufibacter ruber]
MIKKQFVSHYTFREEYGDQWALKWCEYMIEECGVTEHPSILKLKALPNDSHSVFLMLVNGEVINVAHTIQPLQYYWNLIKPKAPILMSLLPDVVVVKSGMTKKEAAQLRREVKENPTPYLRKEKIANLLKDI